MNGIQLHSKLEIKNSNIHGLGVFAKEKIDAGTKLAYFTGTEMTRSEILDKYGDLRFVYRRMPWQKWICSREAPNAINFVNDGVFERPDPKYNCILRSRWLINIVDLKEGEELLLDYGRTYWKNMKK